MCITIHEETTSKKFSIVLLLFLLLFTGCDGEHDTESASDAIKTQGYAPEETYELPIEVTDRSNWKSDEKIQKVAEFEGNISLYGINAGDKEGGTKVLISWNGQEVLFDWQYMTPQGFSLTPFCFDVDNDGEKEIAAIIHVGSGTGVSVDELHIVKRDAESGELVDFLLPREIYQSFPEDGKVGQLGNIVNFVVENETIYASFGIGMVQMEPLKVDYVATLKAELHFADGVFVLTAFVINGVL